MNQSALFTAVMAAATAGGVHAQYRPSASSPWAYGGNTGWINAAAGTGSAALRLGPCVCAGFLYSANCGWINLGDGQPADGTRYANTDGSDCGVNVLPDGRLRGLAWGASIGWISFEDTGNPAIDSEAGRITGRAWSSTTGWISFSTPETSLLLTSGDSDLDTIPDAWELLHAPSLIVLGLKADSDGDGESDAEEYAADTNPLDRASVLRITHLTMNPAAAGGTLRWTSSPSRNYRIQVSTDLVNWTFLTSPLFYYGEDFGINTAAVPWSGTAQFFRVIALKPPAGE